MTCMIIGNTIGNAAYAEFLPAHQARAFIDCSVVVYDHSIADIDHTNCRRYLCRSKTTLQYFFPQEWTSLEKPWFIERLVSVAKILGRELRSLLRDRIELDTRYLCRGQTSLHKDIEQ